MFSEASKSSGTDIQEHGYHKFDEVKVEARDDKTKQTLADRFSFPTPECARDLVDLGPEYRASLDPILDLGTSAHPEVGDKLACTDELAERLYAVPTCVHDCAISTMSCGEAQLLKLENEDGTIFVHLDRFGYVHRHNGPAIVHVAAGAPGRVLSRTYVNVGERHREYGPAFIKFQGDQVAELGWCYAGLAIRERGPTHVSYSLHVEDSGALASETRFRLICRKSGDGVPVKKVYGRNGSPDVWYANGLLCPSLASAEAALGNGQALSAAIEAVLTHCDEEQRLEVLQAYHPWLSSDLVGEFEQAHGWLYNGSREPAGPGF